MPSSHFSEHQVSTWFTAIHAGKAPMCRSIFKLKLYLLDIYFFFSELPFQFIDSLTRFCVFNFCSSLYTKLPILHTSFPSEIRLRILMIWLGISLTGLQRRNPSFRHSYILTLTVALHSSPSYGRNREKEAGMVSQACNPSIQRTEKEQWFQE